MPRQSMRTLTQWMLAVAILQLLVAIITLWATIR
jgi:hypothetical protein